MAQLEDIEYAIGDTVKLVGRDSYNWVRLGEQVKVVDIQDGMFPGDFYTIVQELDDKRRAAAHYWRFEKV